MFIVIFLISVLSLIALYGISTLHAPFASLPHIYIVETGLEIQVDWCNEFSLPFCLLFLCFSFFIIPMVIPSSNVVPFVMGWVSFVMDGCFSSKYVENVPPGMVVLYIDVCGFKSLDGTWSTLRM